MCGVGAAARGGVRSGAAARVGPPLHSRRTGHPRGRGDRARPLWLYKGRSDSVGRHAVARATRIGGGDGWVGCLVDMEGTKGELLRAATLAAGQPLSALTPAHTQGLAQAALAAGTAARFSSGVSNPRSDLCQHRGRGDASHVRPPRRVQRLCDGLRGGTQLGQGDGRTQHLDHEAHRWRRLARPPHHSTRRHLGGLLRGEHRAPAVHPPAAAPRRLQVRPAIVRAGDELQPAGVLHLRRWLRPLRQRALHQRPGAAG
mmetsp:Transcript_50596/g.167630  ORF Transcript_50596/g.167630 Transcript_50596/m.167630 type:complete len:258 (-) Transcript_50596:768-1541(-)